MVYLLPEKGNLPSIEESVLEDREEVARLEARAKAALRSASMLLESERKTLAKELANQARKIRVDPMTPGGRVRAMMALLDRSDGFERTLHHPAKLDKKGGPKLRQPSPGSRSGARRDTL